MKKRKTGKTSLYSALFFKAFANFFYISISIFLKVIKYFFERERERERDNFSRDKKNLNLGGGGRRAEGAKNISEGKIVCRRGVCNGGYGDVHEHEISGRKR